MVWLLAVSPAQQPQREEEAIPDTACLITGLSDPPGLSHLPTQGGRWGLSTLQHMRVPWEGRCGQKGVLARERHTLGRYKQVSHDCISAVLFWFYTDEIMLFCFSHFPFFYFMVSPSPPSLPVYLAIQVLLHSTLEPFGWNEH